MPEVAKAFPDQTVPVHGQLGNSHDPEAARGSADRRIRRSERRSSQRKDESRTRISPPRALTTCRPGPGYGNGTGGAKGAKGVVASTGFGNGVAVGSGGGGNHGTVQQGGFADRSDRSAGSQGEAGGAPFRIRRRWKFFSSPSRFTPTKREPRRSKGTCCCRLFSRLAVK